MTDENKLVDKIKEQFGFLQDSKGNYSSKRLIGCLIIGISLIISIFIITWDIFKPLVLSPASVDILKTMWYTGFGLLGISVFEFFGGK